MRLSLFARSLILAGFCFAVTPVFAIPIFQITDLGTLGGSFSQAFDINDAGQIVGQSTLANGDTHAFLYTEGAMMDLGTLGGANSVATVINNAGLIAGTSDEAGNQVTSAFSTSGGPLFRIGLSVFKPGSLAVMGINQGGAIVATRRADDVSRGYLFSEGKLSAVGHGMAVAVDIDNRGRVLGYGPAKNGPQALLIAKGKSVPLGALGEVANFPSAMNESGEIVGTLKRGRHAFQFVKGAITVLRKGFTGTVADVNDAGVTIGQFVRFGESFPFVAEGAYPVSLQPFVTFDSPPPFFGSWKILAVTGINNRYEIAGFGIPPGTSDTHAFLLAPRNPGVFIVGERRRTSRNSRATVRGWAFGPATAVEYSLDFRPFLPVTGFTPWQFKVKLKTGRNVIAVRAQGPSGPSIVEKIVIYRR